MKKFTLILIALTMVLFAGNLFAQWVGDPVVVDQTGTDMQNAPYSGTMGTQITVDDDGKVHVVYLKTILTETDTTYKVVYANVTDGTNIDIPSQQPDDDYQAGGAFIGGGTDGLPVYILYGPAMSYGYMYGPSMHNQSMAKVSADGSAIDPLGVQLDGHYYADPHYSVPTAMEVDAVNGFCHVVLTGPGGDHLAYWNFDGTNFGEIFNMYSPNAGADVPGLSVPGKYRPNATKGTDVAVSPDGSEVAVAGLHPRRQVEVTLGTFGGEIWPDDMFLALDDGSLIYLYDTTGVADGTNIPNNDPKPYTEVNVAYDADGNIHVVYEATYIDIAIDTTSSWPVNGWAQTFHAACVGDKEAQFYDGTEHPKPQLLYWNNVDNTISTLAEAEYPLLGEKYGWWKDAEFDSGAGIWGKTFNDGWITDLELVPNMNPAEGEPTLVCVWEEKVGTPELIDGTGYSRLPGPTVAHFDDIKISALKDGAWTAPKNISNTPDKDESEISVNRDIVDNTIHVMYFQDEIAGSDCNVSGTDAYGDNYVQYASHQTYAPIRIPELAQVDVVYQAYNLAGLTSIADKAHVPGEFNLAQNFPNPFNPTTTITYSVPTGDVTMDIFNVLGQKVKTLVNKSLAAGTYNEVWDGTNEVGELVASGVYMYKLKSEAGVKVKKMLFQK